MSYHRLWERWATTQRSHLDLSIDYEIDCIEHEDFDIPGVRAVSPTGRVMLVVEGERHLVGPIIEKAQEQIESLARSASTA